MAPNKFIFILLLVFALLPVPDSFGEAAPSGKLLKIVALSRHGVRSPTQSDKTLALWSTKTWPSWPVKRGELTPRGFELVRAMWQNMRARMHDQGLFENSQCPPPESIFVRSDIDERDQATSRAILEGLAGKCRLGYAVTKDEIDPLFHPVKAGLYRFDPISVATDVLEMTRGGFDHLQESLAGPMNLLNKISGSPAPKLCAHFSLTPECLLVDIPNAVSVSPEGKDIHLVGGLSIASSMAEIFLLEYAQWPGVEAGWGQVNASTLVQVLPVHSRIFDVINRAPVVAWARGSSLLLEMTAALLGEHYDQRLNKAKLAVFVGHDTNIANLGGLLGIRWLPKGYPLNGIPPASVLMFELWEQNGKKEVRVRFFAQKPEALHAQFVTGPDGKFDGYDALAHAPTEASVKSPPIVGQVCYDLEVFDALVRKVIAGAPLAPEQTPPLVYPD